MIKFDVHVCFVSEQPLPNFIPIIDAEFRPNKKVLLLVSKQMQTRANTLQTVIRQRCPGLEVEQVAIHDEYDIERIGSQVSELLLNEIEHGSVALNLTGGNKPMAIAAFNAFRDLEQPSFYFTVSSNEVLVLEKDKQTSRLTLQPKMKVDDYLTLYGYPVREGQISRKPQYQLPDLWEKLVQARVSAGEEIGRLNFAINQAEPAVLSVPLPTSPNPQNLDFVVGLFEQHGLLTLKDQKLVFADAAAKKYVGGGWFEDYVFQTAKDIEGVQDVALNVQIENAKDNIYQHNELDVVLLLDNVLCVIECKTANFAKQHPKATEALNKLETLKKLGGLRTHAVLVSYRELEQNARNRAKGADIGIIEQKDLAGMKKLLVNWIKK